VLTEILRTEAPPFHRQHAQLADSGMMWRTRGGWCALLAGRAPQKPAREMAAWPPSEIDRLREVYYKGGMASCVRAFEGRSYHAIAGALKRHKISTSRERPEAMTG
jgi:hypothetical protein